MSFSVVGVNVHCNQIFTGHFRNDLTYFHKLVLTQVPLLGSVWLSSLSLKPLGLLAWPGRLPTVL